MNNNPSQIQIQKIKLSILKIGVMFMLVFGFLGIFDNAQAVVTDLDSKIAACQSSEDEGEQCLLTLKAQCGTGEEGNNCRNKIDATIKSYFPNGITAKAAEANAPAQENALLAEVNSGWGKCPIDVEKCLVWISYALFYSVPSLFLALIGKIFNILVITSLAPNLYGASFIANTWTIVRDISNIFFILILLYTGIKTILGMGSSETKSVLANVVIMAILINFSMFFSKVIIDTSNVVALVFYDKITIELNKNGQKTEYNPLITDMEKDLSGGFMAKADPTKLLSKTFFENIERKGIMGTWEETTITGLLGYVGAGAAVGSAFGGVSAVPGAIAGLSVYAMSSFFDIGSIPDSTLIGIILVVGAILIAFGYALFISSISFLGRLIELWILIIFSPFAFMSFSIPSLAHMDYIGWDNWSKRIISASFMAPIFMFFLYFIYEIINTNLWIGLAKTGQKTGLEVMVLTFLPGIMIAMLILKAADFAKKGSGQAGELVMSGAKMLAGLAVGGAAIGTAYAGRKIVGNSAAALSKRSNVMATLKFDQEYKKWVAGGSLQGAQPVSTAQPLSLLDRAGLKISRSQLESGEVAHAVHERDELKKSAGVEGLSDDQISSTDEMRMESEFIKKHKKDIEDEIRAGIGSDGKAITINQPKDKRGAFLVDRNGNPITANGEEDFKAQRRQKLLDIQQANRGQGVPLEDSDRKRVEGQLNTEFAAILRGMLATEGSVKYEHLKDEALNKKLGMGTQILAKSTSGSYDPRKLADVRPGKTDSMNAKIGLGIIAAVATGMRVGLKQGAGVNSGTSQRDLLKDLGNTISESFKSAKINIDFGGGHGGGHDDSHKTSGGGHH